MIETFSRRSLRILKQPLVREILICLAFLALTSLMTWPWINYLRDAVSDTGDPYSIAWSLWWDYHQTFHDPIHLFHANIFYPYQYTLAFTENEYGVALLFFPLFALGLRPLTVHSIATFVGFAFCGYAAFRLARTLTNSYGVAWVAGVVFAFIPFRFHLLPHLHYLFAGWIPLLFEAFVLFVRRRSWVRTSWLGVAFVMNTLTCISWGVFTAIPLGLSAIFLLTRDNLWSDRDFWRKAIVSFGLGFMVLLPFLWPYYKVHQLYGFAFGGQEVEFFSASPLNWLVVDPQNKLWHGLGESLPKAYIKLFPGLLPILFSLAAVFLIAPATDEVEPDRTSRRYRTLLLLDALVVICAIVALLATGYNGLRIRSYIFSQVSVQTLSLSALVFLFVIRCCLSYPRALRVTRGKNLIEWLRSGNLTDASGLGSIWFVTGFITSLGVNTFLYRFFSDYIPLFKAVRIPPRGAMVAYLGLALLAGLGVQRVLDVLKRSRRPLWSLPIYAIIMACLLFELRAAPLKLIRGEVFPDSLTLRLKETPMKGGIVELPARDPFLYMLRAADHGKPTVVSHATFDSPLVGVIRDLTSKGPVSDVFMDLLESIPASYLVVHRTTLTNSENLDVNNFVVKHLFSRRLKYIATYDNVNDLYAVVKTEPAAKRETP